MTRSAVIPEGKNGVLIQIKAVTKSFQQHDVLKRLDITLYPGQFTSIIGKSGSGKSTLLKLISGLDAPSEGDILLDGEALNGISGSTTMMFQDSRLLPWKSVIDNVGIGLQGEWRPKALHFLQQVGLENKAEQWPSTLSGGQKQRVALARALVRNPRMLLLDEPLGALDALTRLEMQQLIERLWLEQRFTALLVTHDVNEAITLSDRILLLEDGDIALDMDIDLPRPRSRTDSQVGKWERQILDRIMRNS
ncbi:MULTISPECIES: ATP-binding cassette domain-containing protein [unclassified Paenibacillus]|uniref:ATP-binding cassette domain-containing protein n=1 Tax=unclassified Paenibacillus TaxID=185978 RepID=UPI00119CFAB3|nr:ATP-binding cassette domain-containing protein [Paenibacillus sp. 32O-W]